MRIRCRMSIAVPLIGAVMEAIQKSISGVIGRFAATSASPMLSRWRSLSFVTTTVTAPAISFFATIACIAAPIPGEHRFAGESESREAKSSGESEVAENEETRKIHRVTSLRLANITLLWTSSPQSTALASCRRFAAS